ncbi:DUF4476 domain-containing protein [Anaeromyxobacter diazotrophicus]|uniref:DUF4476 domain-containing protein n=1 Tax=Anaeromyxobacter diazotrophicus TaxID=2590199 RepID=A0A7I9VQG2_9BACT|nr:DUF4476 domain-containing protein [Anaeromyxobacter diazotrophicus]GEJ58652.1 hypothetical protein AMYX_33930 [Anaeromyxobacter diazotrophicus]
MKWIAAVALAATALTAWAQPAPELPGFTRPRELGPEPRPAPAYPAPAPAPARAALSIDYAQHPQGATLVAVRAPDGTPCRIADERGLVAEGGAPLTVRAHPGALYRVEILPPGRPPLTGEVAASAGQVATTWAAVPLLPAPPPPVAGPAPMDPDAFDGLLQSLGRGPEVRQLERVRAAARRNYFLVNQVLDLLDAFTFGSSKLRVLELTRDRILDREHERRILERFSFPPERERARQLLARG